MTFMCGVGDVTPSPVRTAKVSVHRYRCPWCLGFGRWASGETCHACAGVGTTNDPADGVDLHNDYAEGVDAPTTKAEPLPRPPAVMRAPCVDCAYRPGSPEQEGGMTLPKGDEMPFMCHHGLQRIDHEDGSASYLPALEAQGFPIGAFVCASWYALALDEPLPDSAFKDPGGSDRTETAPSS
jgi:hypothetical protein